MKRILSAFLCICASFCSYADATEYMIKKRDSIPASTPSALTDPAKRRKHIIIGTNGLIYTGTLSTLYQTWYRNYPQSRFHTFNDQAEWLQMDKIGHTYTAYAISRGSGEMWKYTTLSENQRIWIGGLSGAFYQTILETLDAFSAQWGWSWGDVAANLIGSGLYISQELGWKEQRVQIKTSFHRKTYDDPVLNDRSNALFGTSLAERCLKDYNGQTYWLSADIHSFLPKLNIPSWLQLSVGTGVEGVFGARSNKAYDADGQVVFDRSNIQRTRQWYLAPDIDWTKIRTNKKWVRTMLFVLNSFKFPAPAIEWNNTGIKCRWIVF